MSLLQHVRFFVRRRRRCCCCSSAAAAARPSLGFDDDRFDRRGFSRSVGCSSWPPTAVVDAASGERDRCFDDLVFDDDDLDLDLTVFERELPDDERFLCRLRDAAAHGSAVGASESGPMSLCSH